VAFAYEGKEKNAIKNKNAKIRNNRAGQNSKPLKLQNAFTFDLSDSDFNGPGKVVLLIRLAI
jgi:hypothetical protein